MNLLFGLVQLKINVNRIKKKYEIIKTEFKQQLKISKDLIDKNL